MNNFNYLWNQIKNTLNKILDIFSDKKIKINFKDKNNKLHYININFDNNFIPHSLAIDIIPYFKKINLKWSIISKIKNNDQINLKKIFSKVSDKQKWKIKEKILSWNEIFDFINQKCYNNLKIFTELQFITHYCDFGIIMNKGCFILCKLENTEIYYDYYIKSISYLK